MDSILLECLQRIFSNWEALRMAVENRAGGPQSWEKAEWIPTAFIEWSSNNSNFI